MKRHFFHCHPKKLIKFPDFIFPCGSSQCFEHCRLNAPKEARVDHIRFACPLPFLYDLIRSQIAMCSATDTISSYNLIYFAQSLIGTPYREASSNPSYGFDCSGFVSYVFKSFNADVPRSSEDFINVGRKIRLEDARTGDIILFTGTKSHHPHRIGHVGIVYCNDGGGLKFIHSTSGKEYGVTISSMDDRYKRRFVQSDTPIETKRCLPGTSELNSFDKIFRIPISGL